MGIRHSLPKPLLRPAPPPVNLHVWAHNKVNSGLPQPGIFLCATHTQAGESLKVWHIWHYCSLIEMSDTSLARQQGAGVDTGGGTISISLDVVTNVEPLQVEESFQPQCKST